MNSNHAVVLSQKNVSGIIRDAISKEVLIGANIYDPVRKNGITSDNNGYFNIIVDKDCKSIRTTFIGYKTQDVELSNLNDTIFSIFLIPGSEIEEVEITAYRKHQFNQSRLSNEQLKYIPAIAAESDVLKSLQLLPGVQSLNEGSSNLSIRGGGPGENLYLIDNVPLYYVNHLGGFISVFNPDVINDVRILKGGFPAKYGGRLSSVVDITMREGDASGFKGSAGIGVVGAHLNAEGPLANNTSYLFAVRKTFTELLLGSVSYLSEGNDNIVTYGFYDLNGKISWRPDSKKSVHASLYIGDDLWGFTVFDDGDIIRFRNRWGNIMGSVAWKQILNAKLQFNNTLSLSRYRVKDLRAFYLDPYLGEYDKYNSNSLSSVKDITLKSDWKYRVFKSWAIDFGVQSSYLVFLPNLFWDNNDNPRDNQQNVNGLESAMYLENQISLGRYFDMNIGVRGVQYVTDNFSAYSLEPRIDISFSPITSQAINFTYMKTNQFSQMVFSSGSFLTNEVWIPSGVNIEPANVEQYSVGWKGSFFKNMMSAEIGLYQKQMSNLVAFKEGYSNLRGDVQWKKKIETDGIGNSKGMEFFLSKNKGAWTGFLSYTFSSTTRQFDNINNGEPYVFEYDRPHSFAIDIHKKINNKWTANVLWVYQTGLPYTPAIGRYYAPYNSVDGIIYENEVLIYGERNSERMRSYHRLDIGLKYFTKTKKGRDATWTFSVYNAYNRQNPYYYYYNTEPGLNFGTIENRSGFQKLYQLSYFPILPTVSYTVEF
ncbi:MAG: TonB-dependent receptor plug domain-containing protein [Bacteroidales bacterium]